MLNLAEILTLIIGFFLAIVFIDGIRRSLRIRNSKLKVDTPPVTILDGHGKSAQIKNDKQLSTDQDTINRPLIKSIHQDEEILNNHLLILKLSSKDLEPFSFSSISNILSPYKFYFEEKGFFTFRNADDGIMFTLLNGKKPGTFYDKTLSSDIALVLDLNKSENMVDSLNSMISLAQTLSETFSCELLDENRNPLTKQMLEHMKNKTQEYKRQNLASVN